MSAKNGSGRGFEPAPQGVIVIFGQPVIFMTLNLLKIFILTVLITCGAIAQDPARWSLSSDAAGKTLKSGAELKAQLKADIDDGWHLYALDQPAGGPVPTTITISANSPFTIVGEISAPQPSIRADQNFIVNDRPLQTKFFEKNVVFGINALAKSDVPADQFAVNVRFQLCNDKFCLPPKTLRLTFAGSEVISRSRSSSGQIQRTANKPFISQSSSDDTIWGFIWLAFTFGALSLLTPCVFPMIPITVSYFMKHSDGNRAKTIKLATVYSVGIIATFSLLGMLLAIFLGAAGITLFAANPWVNLIIAAIFILFAFNLFGFYEIAVPASLLTKLDKITRVEEGKGSAYIGALLMGLTFTLTSFTCTSPFIGTILVSTAQGNWKMPLLGMVIFSTVFALPFFVLATVPRILQSLPRSGGWLNSVKVVMGFLEIAAAVKFLSNIDLVWGARYAGSSGPFYGFAFTREMVLLVWVAIGGCITLYILGIFKFRHDSPVKKLSPLRVI